MFYKIMQSYKDHTRQIIALNRFYSSSTNLSLKLNTYVNGVNLDKYILELERRYTANNAAKLEPTATLLKSRRAIIEQIENLYDLLTDKDMEIVKLATEEKASCINSLKSVDDALIVSVLDLCEHEANGNKGSCTSMLLEVNAGVGGQEAMLFASELFDMYVRFIKYKGWDHYVAEDQRTDLGGIRHGSVIVHEAEAWQYLQYEAGVHRVQRIPSTEKCGRLHTSTVSVLALPQPTDIQVHIQPNDLRVDTKRATGAGGQHVNTTDSAVRIVHLPTGLVVECQTDRSQIRNKHVAMERLRIKLYDLQLQAQLAHTQAIKSNQVQSSSRNEKIRTYNYSQDRITDHRLQKSSQNHANSSVHNIKAFMLGGQHLESLIHNLRINNKYETLFKAINDYERNNK